MVRATSKSLSVSMATLPSRVPLICPLRMVVLMQPTAKIAAMATIHQRPPTCLMRPSLYAHLLDDHKSTRSEWRGNRGVSILARVEDDAGRGHADAGVAVGEEVGNPRELTR